MNQDTTKNNHYPSPWKGNLIMLVVTMLWGSSYLFMKLGLDTLESFNLVALRLGFAFIFSGLVFYKRLRKVNLRTIRYGFILGFILFMTMAVVTIAVKYTSVSNAGFLFSLTVVFVPLLLAILYRKWPERKILFGIGIAVIGILLLTLKRNFQISLGDILIISGALFYAIYIILTDKVAKNVDSINLGIVELGFGGAFGTLFSFLFENTQLPSTTESWLAILALSILCSAIGFIGQNIAQKYTTPTNAGLIFSLEPVFAAIFAFTIFKEVLSIKGYVGATLVLVGVLLAKIDVKKLAGKSFKVKQPHG